MAVTQVIRWREGISGSLTSKYQDASVQEVFKISLNAESYDLPAIASAAKLFAPSIFPGMGQAWITNPTYGLYAKKFDFAPEGGGAYNWIVTVSYQPLEAGEQNTENGDNPLFWPATYQLEYIEFEEAVTEARNIQPIGGNSASPRAANTLGPVVNGALQEFEEGIMAVVRDSVIHISKNVATLNEVVQVNNNYTRTTNSDLFLGAPIRSAKFLGADAPGQQEANGFQYYPMTIRVQITKTTDIKMNNIGWHNLNFDGELVKYLVKDDETGEMVTPSEPGFLTLAGARSSLPVHIGFRYLRETSYAGLLL